MHLGAYSSTANGIGSHDFNVRAQVDDFILITFNSQSLKHFFDYGTKLVTCVPLYNKTLHIYIYTEYLDQSK